MKKAILMLLCVMTFATAASLSQTAQSRERRCVIETQDESSRVTRERSTNCDNEQGDDGDQSTPPAPQQKDLHISLALNAIPNFVLPGSSTVPISSITLDASHSDKNVNVTEIEFSISAESATHGARLENCSLVHNNSELDHSGRRYVSSSVFDNGKYVTEGTLGFTYPLDELTVPAHQTSNVSLVCDLIPEFEGVLTIGIAKEKFVAKDSNGHNIDLSFGSPASRSIGVGVILQSDNNPPTDNSGETEGDSENDSTDTNERDHAEKPAKADRDRR